MFLRRALRALILALVTGLFIFGTMSGFCVGMGIATHEFEFALASLTVWLHSSSWVVIAIGYPTVVATLGHADLRRSVPVVTLVLFVSGLIAGIVGQHGGCIVIFILPFIALGTLIACGLRFGVKRAS